MTWVAAVALRPFFALAFFGFAAFVAYLIRPLIPPSWRSLLYDRTLRKQHPWKFFFATCVAVYGTILLVAWLVGYW